MSLLTTDIMVQELQNEQATFYRSIGILPYWRHSSPLPTGLLPKHGDLRPTLTPPIHLDMELLSLQSSERV